MDQIGLNLFKLDQLVQTWSNLIKLDQNRFSTTNVIIKSCHICRKDRNECFIFDFFGSDLSKMDQTWSNLIKLDEIGFLTNQKMLLLKVVTFTERIEMTVWFLIFLDQICQKWIKLDQTFGQKWIFGSNGFSAEIAFLPIILLSNLKWLFGQKCFLARNGLFSNKSALLLKVLKGLARLWWLKAFRLVLIPPFQKTTFRN